MATSDMNFHADVLHAGISMSPTGLYNVACFCNYVYTSAPIAVKIVVKMLLHCKGIVGWYIRVSVMLVSILITFVLCHLLEPLSHSSLFAVLWGVCEVYSESHYTQIMVTNGLEWFSFASNFIFYCIFHKQFQDSLKKSCCWLCHRHNVTAQMPATCLTAESKETAFQNNNTG
ncbi:hypothetical protein CAPTEDRAFT_216221 [Capitella teleta]|uniref:Uncharacterized protein n=1 Tax=Capitella teleta TaxID=283909 RepID=R7V3R1_CAPTE|nr:hypothetical protein CAPTEDRAFT_216221 [Capitella teleta]|eukprot:ELU13493.1 hypothetical protein CAPTEDRAFT_216221 [Capitella teleta]